VVGHVHASRQRVNQKALNVVGRRWGGRKEFVMNRVQQTRVRPVNTVQNRQRGLKRLQGIPMNPQTTGECLYR